MARMIPNVLPPNVKSNAEIKIFQWFKNAPETDDWIVLYSVMETNTHPTLVEGETDFLVLAPELGMFALEVKGGRVSRDENGIWSFTNKYGMVTEKARGPYEQAKDGIHAVVKYLQEKNPSGSLHEDLGKVFFGYGVMFPDIYFCNEDFGIGESQDEVFDLSYGQNVVRYIQTLSRHWVKAAEGKVRPRRFPTISQCEHIARQLRSGFDLVPPLSKQAEEAEQELLRLTEEEYDAIDETLDNRHMLFLGGAGTGKTLVALEAARRSQEKRIALICYNRNLGEWLKDKVSSFANRELIQFVGTFHSLIIGNIRAAGLSAKIDFDDLEGDDDNLIGLFDQSLKIHPICFDQLIVDEVQDLVSDNYLLAFDLIMARGLRKGRFSFFGDFQNQAIYRHGYISEEDACRKIEEISGACPIRRLIRNCRNTPEICKEIGFLTNHWYKKQMKAPSNIKVKFVCDWGEDQQIEAAKVADAISRLTSEGVRRSQIVILSPYKRENSCVRFIKGVTDFDPVNRAKVTFSTIHSFKGLESEAVLLCDMDDYSDDPVRFSLLYVALSRARTILIVFETLKATEQRLALRLKHTKGEKHE